LPLALLVEVTGRDPAHLHPGDRGHCLSRIPDLRQDPAGAGALESRQLGAAKELDLPIAKTPELAPVGGLDVVQVTTLSQGLARQPRTPGLLSV